MMQITPTVKQLLIINVLVYIGSQVVGAQAYQMLSLYYFENPNFQVWQPITSMFMHAQQPSLTHILFNMLAFYSFGSALEHFWGPTKFIFFYISCGLGAAALQMGLNYYQVQEGLHLLTSHGFTTAEGYALLQGQSIPLGTREGIDMSLLNEAFGAYNFPMLGASGAIYGLFVAFAFMFPNAELAMLFIPIPIKAKYFVPGIIAIDLFLGLKGQSIFGAGGTGIAHFAHIGGALVGFVMMWYWKKNQFNNKRWN
jgi:membrane associated rhomboid family serine protease